MKTHALLLKVNLKNANIGDRNQLLMPPMSVWTSQLLH